MKAWRESAALIIAARNKLTSTQSYDYSLLFLKRQRAGKFAGAYVFPGGVIEPSDADLKWQNLFKNQGYSEDSLTSIIPQRKTFPQIFNSQKNELPREISLRITAIRETFEESGILICKKPTELITSKEAQQFNIKNDEIKSWQDKVHSNASEFYNMCESLECCPNIWALHEWANWLTPSYIASKIRFNAAFFLVCLSEIPHTIHESSEIEDLVWMVPDEVLASLKSSLMPPQVYEISKITKYQKFHDLLDVAIETSKRGVKQYLPVRVNLSDGSTHLLPGDSMYPEQVDEINKQIIDKTSISMKEFREMSTHTHRTEHADAFLKDGDKLT